MIHKVFLSHSSADKGIVRPTFEQLGAGLAHYDERTFEPDGSSAQTILEALSTCSIFVFFLSANALTSTWVSKELVYAEHLFFNGTIKKIIIIPIDNTPRSKLPFWMTPFVVQQLPNAKFIAARIRSSIQELATAERPSADLFIGRDSESTVLKSELSRSELPRASAVFISGIDGIGRRKLLQRAYADVFPFLPKVHIEIELLRFEGEVEFYEKLLADSSPWRDVEDNAVRPEKFLTLDETAKTDALVGLLSTVAGNKQTIVVKGGEELFDENGHVISWLGSLLSRLDAPYPVLAVVSSKKPRLGNITANARVVFLHLSSLSTESSKSLLSLAAFPDESPDPNVNIDNIIDLAEGHPGLIHMAANAIRRGFVDMSDARKTIASSVAERASAMVSKLNLTDSERRIVALIDELGALTITDLEVVFSSEDTLDYLPIVARLEEYGVIEGWANSIRIAPFLRRAVVPSRDISDIQMFLSMARKKLVNFLNEFDSFDGENIGLLSAAILASIRETGDFKSVLAARPLVASRFLHVARSLYDGGDYYRALEVTQKAYELQIALSDEARIEALRLKGLAAARLGEDAKRDDAIAELVRIGTTKARRIAKFIDGFSNRLRGSYDTASTRYAEAYALDGAGDYHVLRERAFISLFAGDTDDAEKFSRSALKVAPTNAHTLDILLQVLIQRFKIEKTSQNILNEIEDRLNDLRRYQTLGDRFYETNEILLNIVKKNFKNAEELIKIYSNNKKITKSQHLMLEAQLFLSQRFYSKAEDAIKYLQAHVYSSNRRFGSQSLVAAKALLIELFIDSSAFGRAHSELSDTKVRLPARRLHKLELSLAEGVAHSMVPVGSDLLEWAKRKIGKI